MLEDIEAQSKELKALATALKDLQNSVVDKVDKTLLSEVQEKHVSIVEDIE